MKTDYQTVKDDLKLKDNEIDTHETDLYVKDSEKARCYFKIKKHSFSCFKSEIDGKTWLDIPFYLIDDKIRRATRKRG